MLILLLVRMCILCNRCFLLAQNLIIHQPLLNTSHVSRTMLCVILELFMVRIQREEKKNGKQPWLGRQISLFFFLVLPYAPSLLLSPSCHTPQQLVPDGSGDQAAGITRLWKAFSMYGWMDGWSCVYSTIFSVLFLRLDYSQHKRDREPLVYRHLLFTPLI